MPSTIGEYRDRTRDLRTSVPELDAALTAQSITFVATATRQQKVKLLLTAVKGKKRSDPAPYDFPPLATTTTLSITTATLPGATVGTAYPALTLAAAGGTAPYTWDVTGLPAGITHAVGVISGTPSAAGTFSVTIRVTDAAGTTIAQTLSVVVASAAAPVPPYVAPAGWHWEWRKHPLTRKPRFVLIADPAAPAPTPIPPPQHARHGHNQFDGGLLLWLLGLLGILAIAALLTFWVIVPAARWGWDQSWEDDSDDTTEKVSGLTDEEIQQIINAIKGTESVKDKPNTGGNKPNGTADTNGAAHEAHLKELDPVFYGKGLEAWMKSAGMSFSSVTKRAQEPEQETFGPPKRTYVAAYQVATTNLNVPWPACLTTDQPVANHGASYQPDPTKPSVIYTDVKGFTGNSTVYADCTTGEGVNLNHSGSSAAVANTAGSGSSIKTIEDVKSLGTVVQDMGTGVQLRLNQDIANLKGFVIQKDNANVASASKGDLVSIWKQ